MKSTTLNIKPNVLVKQRNDLTDEIARYWNILKTENIVRKNVKRNYDLKSVLVRIKACYDNLVLIKVRLQCANMGLAFKDLSKDANVLNIYRLSALNELHTKLTEMMEKHTINPLLKAKKGKKNLAITEELTYNYLKNEVDKCIIPLNELKKKIEEFNDNTELSNEVPTFLTA